MIKRKLRSKFDKWAEEFFVYSRMIQDHSRRSNRYRMEANRLENVSAWYFFNWLRCWSRFGRVDKPLKRMINRERKREKGDRYIWRKKNLIMSPHGKGHDRYQFIFRLKRDSLPQLHDATSATRDPFPPFRMAWNSIFSKPIQLCGRASRNRIRVWHSCSPWFKLSPLSMHSFDSRLKMYWIFPVQLYDFSMYNYLHSSCSWDFVVNLNSWNLFIQFFKLLSFPFKFQLNLNSLQILHSIDANIFLHGILLIKSTRFTM